MNKFSTELKSTAAYPSVSVIEMHPPDKMTTRAAAVYAGVSIATFRNWEAHGITPPRTEGYRRLYSKVDIYAFVKRLKDDALFRQYRGVYLPKRKNNHTSGPPPVPFIAPGTSPTQIMEREK